MLKMSHMNSSAVLAAAKVGSLSALWARIDSGAFPRPVAFSAGASYWDAVAVRHAIAVNPSPVLPKKRPTTPPRGGRSTSPRARSAA